MSLILALLILAGVEQDPPASVVAKGWVQFAERITRRDAEAVADLFTVDARLMEPGIDDLLGRVAVLALFKTFFSGNVRPTDTRMMPREVAGYGGVIYDQGDYVQTMAPQGDPRRAYDIYGRYFAVWAEQTDGTWKIARLMFSLKKQPTR